MKKIFSHILIGFLPFLSCSDEVNVYQVDSFLISPMAENGSQPLPTVVHEKGPKVLNDSNEQALAFFEKSIEYNGPEFLEQGYISVFVEKNGMIHLVSFLFSENEQASVLIEPCVDIGYGTRKYFQVRPDGSRKIGTLDPKNFRILFQISYKEALALMNEKFPKIKSGTKNKISP